MEESTKRGGNSTTVLPPRSKKGAARGTGIPGARGKNQEKVWSERQKRTYTTKLHLHFASEIGAHVGPRRKPTERPPK